MAFSFRYRWVPLHNSARGDNRVLESNVYLSVSNHDNDDDDDDDDDDDNDDEDSEHGVIIAC